MGSEMSAATNAPTDAVFGVVAEKMAWTYVCVQIMPTMTETRFASVICMPPAKRLNQVSAGSAS